MDEDTFASCSRDKTIQMSKRDNETMEFKFIRKWVGHDASTVLNLVSLGNGLIASSGADFTIRVFQVQTGKEAKKIKAHSDWVWKLLRMGDHHLISCSESGSIKIWNTTSWEI